MGQDDAVAPSPGSASASPSPWLVQASDLSPRPMGRSQLPADVGKRLGGWTGRLSGPALCPENLLCHCSSARQAQTTSHFPCPWQDRAGGPSSPPLVQLTTVATLLPPGPGNRSLQYKCTFTGVPSLRLAAPACTAGWGHELTLAQRRKGPSGLPPPQALPTPQPISSTKAPESLSPSSSLPHKACDGPAKAPLTVIKVCNPQIVMTFYPLPSWVGRDKASKQRGEGQATWRPMSTIITQGS